MTAGRRNGRAAGVWVLGVLLGVWPSGRPAAQVAPNRASAYVHPSDVYDARAVWVNPGGLGVIRQASVYAELLVEDPGARGRLRQVSAGFNARGLSFGYQRDVFDGGVRGDTYRLGLGGSAGSLGIGGAVAYYRGGGTRATGWDVGLLYRWLPSLTLGATVANLGQPVVRGLRQRVMYLPGVTWRPLAAAVVSAHARLTSDSVAAYAFSARWGIGLGSRRLPLDFLVRLDTDGGLRRSAFAFGLSLGGMDQIGLIASTPGEASRIEAVSLYGLSVREPVAR
ncbi:MAG: hypothetical protein ACREMN_13790 [Gemmatimonadales bacterium]